MNNLKPIVTDLEKIQTAINEDQLRAVLIDPFKQQVKEVRVRPHKSADINLHINSNLFTSAQFFSRQVRRGGEIEGNVQHDVFVDDEGLFKPDQRYWFNKATGQVLAGKGLVLGFDDDGNTSHCLWSDVGVKARINWIGDKQTLAMMYKLGVLS